MPIQVPVTQTGLEASIQAAAQRAGRNLKIDLGVSSRSLGSLSQPLGKITGQADQFTKSMEAANARVLAFGASVGVLSAVAQGFREIVTVTIQVEKNMADINSVLGANSTQLNKFKNDIFSVAKETGNSFQTVSDAALELSRQGLKPVEVLTRLKDSMILSRLSGLDAASSVEGLTAAVNSFSKEGVTTSQVLNKISKTAAAFSVSERDLIEGFKRSASVAQQAGVSLDELGGIITAVQEKTARGGAVIGNAFKTIFTRIQRPDSLALLQEVGAQVTDVQGKILPATKLIENLAQKINSLSDMQVANITEKIGGGFQVGPLIAALDDITSKTSTFKGATEAMSTAGSEAYKRNIALNQTLAASINTATVNLQELANTLGEIGVTDSLKNILSFFNSFATDVKEVLQGEGLGSDFAKGLVKGISAVLSGPGLILFAAIIGKLALNFVQFGAAALKTFFNIGSAAKEIGAIQSGIASTLLNNKSIQTQILALEGDRVAQARFFSTALNTQLATMEKMRSIAASIAPAVYTATTGAGKPRAAGGYMPTVMAEANDISKGVGGARPSDRPVVIPNFSFGNGKKGTMVAHTGEHIVPNYKGSGGSAIFNREMVGRMGLPSGAKKIGAAGGFVPNFVDTSINEDLSIARTYGFLNNATGKISLEKLRRASINKSPGKQESAIAAQGLLSRLEGSKEEKTKQLLRYNFSDSVAAKKENRGVAFGMIVNEPYTGGSKTAYAYKNSKGEVIATATQTPNSEAAINVPIYGVNKNRIESQTTDDLISNITDYLVKKTIGLAKELGQGVIPNPIREATIAGTFNKGSAASAAGSVFESAIGSLLGDDDFKDFQNRAAGSLMDFTGPSVKNLKLAPNVFNIPKNEANVGLEAKGSQALFTGAAEKIFKINQGAQAFSIKQDKTKSQLNKGITAASGYIPNFANYVYDADRLSPELRASILPAILATAKPKTKDEKIKTKDEEIRVIDGLLGPAGSGKSTFASKIGPFIQSMADVKKAERFTILSASSLAKDPSGISKPFRSVIEAIKNSKGTLTYLNVSDEEIKKRRENRIAKGSMEGDLRSESNLKGVSYASLNQPEFLDILKKEMGGSFKLESGASGYIPNFVSKSREVGRGDQGAFYKLGEQYDKESKKTIPVGVKRFFKDRSNREIEVEWLVSEYINKSLGIPGVSGPKVMSTLEKSKRKRSIRKEFISDPIATAELGKERADNFGTNVLFGALLGKGITTKDLHGRNYTVNEQAEIFIEQLKSYPSSPAMAATTLAEMAGKGSKINILDHEVSNLGDPARLGIREIMAEHAKQASGGYIPNFAKNQEFDKSLLTNSKIDPSSPMLSLKAGDQTNYGKFLKIEPAGNPKGKYLNAIFESSATGKNVKYSSDQKKRMEFGGGLFWDSVIKEIVPNKNLKNRLYSNDFYSSLANPASKYADVSSKMKVFFDSKGKLDGENLRMHEWNSGTGFSDNISVDGKNLVIEDINPNFDKPIQFNNLYLKALNQAAADLKLKVIKRSSLSNKISNKGESQRFREGFVGSIPKSYAKGFIPNFAVDLQRSPERLEAKSQRSAKKSAKKQNWQTAEGGIGKIFKAIHKAGPTILLDGLVSGAEIQGVNLDHVTTVIKNSGAIAQMLLGDKGSAFISQAQKYGVTFEKAAMKKLTSLAAKSLNKMQGLAGGYIPNFADPLNEAISREIGAGVNPSQIYIDQNNSLKNPMNPSGLMVANRRDEPSGGWQGINRARKEGANAQTYGAAGGFVPNFAGDDYAGMGRSAALGKSQMSYDQEVRNASVSLRLLERENKKLLRSISDYRNQLNAIVGSSPQELAEKQKLIQSLKSQNQKAINLQSKIQQETVSRDNTIRSLEKEKKERDKNINKQTTGLFGREKAISKEGLNPAASQQRDMLGTVFALQAGLSFLTGATSDATSGIAKLSNAVSSVASTATSVLFVGQGLKGLAKEGGVAAGILGKVGIAGAVAAGAFEAFKQVGSYLDSTNLSINKASGAMEKVASAASKAAINLETLKPSQKEAIQTKREALISGATKRESSGNLENIVNFLQGSGYSEVEGFSDKLKTELDKTIDQALAAGVSYKFMWNEIQKASKTGGKITADEVREISSEIEGLINKFNKLTPEKVIKDLGLNLTEGVGRQIAESTPEEFEKMLKTSKTPDKGKRGPLERVQAFLYDADMKEDSTRTQFIESLRETLKTKKEIQEDATSDAVSQVNLNLAKEELKSTLDIASARFRLNDELDDQLLKSELVKNLSEKGIRDLKQEINLRDNNRKLADDTRNLLKQQIDKLSGVTGKEKELIALKSQYAKLTDEELTDQTKVQDLLQGINGLLTEGVDATEEAKKSIQLNLQNLFDTRDIEKERLTINKQNTEEYIDQKNVIDGIVESAKRMSAATSFEKTFAGQGQINANELEIRRLESSKGGKGIKEQREIDIRIKQLEKANILLSNDNKVTADLASAKDKAISALSSVPLTEATKISISKATSPAEIIDKLRMSVVGLDSEQESSIYGAIQFIEEMGRSTQQASENAIAVADANLQQTSRTEAVTAALTLFENSLVGIPQKLADLSLERGMTTSGRKLREIDYERTTLSEMARMNEDKRTPEEIMAYQRERSVKGIGQKTLEAFSETEFDRANRFSDTLVAGAEKFRDTMIDGMIETMEKGGSLGDILQSAAYDFSKEMTRASMRNVFSSLIPSPVLGLASGGKITGGSGNKDDVPAMLMGGEYVMNKRAVSKYGTGFMEALNNGSISGFADGGSVIRSRGFGSNVLDSNNIGDQTGQGGYQMPGYYGSGAITGGKNLLAYATQSYTSGAGDTMGGGANSAYLDLDPESVRLTQFGRTTGPMAAAIKESKQQAFGLYTQELEAKKQAAKEREEKKKAFRNMILMAAISTVASAGIGAVSSGVQAGMNSAGKDAKFMERLGAGFKGAYSGGKINGQNVGGLKNLFSGNFAMSQIGSAKELGTYNLQQKLSTPEGMADFEKMLISGADVPFKESVSQGYTVFDDQSGPLIIARATARATGGSIPQTSGIDTVPAMLSGGEFIMNAAATQRIGTNNLNAMNSGASTSNDSSVINEQLISKLDELIRTTKESSKPVTVNVSSSQQGQAGGNSEESRSEQDQNLSRKIKAAVVAVLQEEKRLGGVLRRS